MKFRRIPEEVNAILFDGGNANEVAEFLGGKHLVSVDRTWIHGPGRGMSDGVEITTGTQNVRGPAPGWVTVHVDKRIEIYTPEYFDRTSMRLTLITRFNGKGEEA